MRQADEPCHTQPRLRDRFDAHVNKGASLGDLAQRQLRKADEAAHIACGGRCEGKGKLCPARTLVIQHHQHNRLAIIDQGKGIAGAHLMDEHLAQKGFATGKFQRKRQRYRAYECQCHQVSQMLFAPRALALLIGVTFCGRPILEASPITLPSPR